MASGEAEKAEEKERECHTKKLEHGSGRCAMMLAWSALMGASIQRWRSVRCARHECTGSDAYSCVHIGGRRNVNTRMRYRSNFGFGVLAWLRVELTVRVSVSHTLRPPPSYIAGPPQSEEPH
eukprot:GHVU01113424.1.p1 GENE.GHVU01113424.1~~GHVU01113424.1.p1  ORF type:complete len:122 (+),score=2.42 GHVU01113424.1:127-492(+)